MRSHAVQDSCPYQATFKIYNFQETGSRNRAISDFSHVLAYSYLEARFVGQKYSGTFSYLFSQNFRIFPLHEVWRRIIARYSKTLRQVFMASFNVKKFGTNSGQHPCL